MAVHTESLPNQYHIDLAGQDGSLLLLKHPHYKTEIRDGFLLVFAEDRLLGYPTGLIGGFVITPIPKG